MFDPNKHIHALARARQKFTGDEDFLLRIVVDDLVDRMGAVQREFETGVALFGRSTDLADKMHASGQVGSVLRVEEGVHLASDADVIATADSIGLADASVDVILAPLGLHWANDLPGALIQLQRALRPDGLLLAVLPGPETLVELRAALLEAESEVTGGAAMRIDPFTEVRDAGGLLQRAGFALPVADHDILTVRYDNAFGLVRDLRNFGATRQMVEPAHYLSRQTVMRMAEIYADKFSDEDGRIRASFQMVSLSGWKPHESQQRPLKPGSAKSRLADALGTKETKI